MTKQIKHKRTSKLGRLFPAGSRIEQIPRKVPQSVKNNNKYGEFETKEKFDDFTSYMSQELRQQAYDDELQTIKDNPEDYVDEDKWDEKSSDYGADDVEGIENMNELQRQFKPYEYETNFSVNDFVDFYKRALIQKNKEIHPSKKDKLYYDTLKGPIKHKNITPFVKRDKYVSPYKQREILLQKGLAKFKVSQKEITRIKNIPSINIGLVTRDDPSISQLKLKQGDIVTNKENTKYWKVF